MVIIGRKSKAIIVCMVFLGVTRCGWIRGTHRSDEGSGVATFKKDCGARTAACYVSSLSIPSSKNTTMAFLKGKP